MGCSQSDFYNPQKTKHYQNFNKPIESEETEKEIYDLLEYWFCSNFLNNERRNHIIDYTTLSVTKNFKHYSHFNKLS